MTNLTYIKYTGKEFETRAGLNTYDFQARQYGPAAPFLSTTDPKAGDYHNLNPFLFCAANPMRYIDFNGDSISVSEEYRDKFMDDLRAVFGDYTDNFSFNASGKLVYSGTTKGMDKNQKNLMSGLSKLMNEKPTTTVIYEKEYHYTGKDGKEYVAKTETESGSFTLRVDGSDDKLIVIDPDYSGTLKVDEITAAFALETRFIENGSYFNQTEIETNRADALFHEFGEALYSKKTDGHKVIDYNNYARRILNLEDRKYDSNHNKYGKKI